MLYMIFIDKKTKVVIIIAIFVYVYYFKDINKASAKYATPNNIVNLLINNSNPLSLRLANKSELPP